MIVQALKAHALMIPLVDGRVSGDLPPKPVFPAITVTLVSDTVPIDFWLSGAALQIDCYGSTREEARLVARTAHAVLVATQGKTDLGVISSIHTLLGVRRMPEPVDNRARYMFEIRAYIHP